jgi:hypothetical protein
VTVVSAPPERVTFVHEPEKEPQAAPERVAESRWIWLEPPATPDPESLPPFAVTATDAEV